MGTSFEFSCILLVSTSFAISWTLMTVIVAPGDKNIFQDKGFGENASGKCLSFCIGLSMHMNEG